MHRARGSARPAATLLVAAAAIGLVTFAHLGKAAASAHGAAPLQANAMSRSNSGFRPPTRALALSPRPSPPPPTALQLYYWPFLGRAGALVRMLDAAGTPYEWVSTDQMPHFMGVLSSRARSFSPVTGTCTDCDTFAPPVIVDGATTISQSVAAAMYVGEKVGFGGGRIPSVPKAVQYMNDLADLNSEALAASLGGGDDPSKLRAFVEGGRLAAWLANIEHSIEGPFYFGAKPTYVDFFALNVFDWAVDDAWLHALAPKLAARSVDVYAPCPRLRALLAALRAEPWHAARAHGGKAYPLNVDGERLSKAALAAY